MGFGNRSVFAFELAWVHHEDFYELVRLEWMSVAVGSTPVERWQNKIQHLRQFLRGWAKHKSGASKILREKLILLIDDLDIKTDTSPLSEPERLVKREADECLAKLRQDEESKWAQRAKVRHIQEGRNNTKYFHLIANGKNSKKNIFQLE